MTEILDQPSMAILIDCWNKTGPNLQSMYSRIIQFLDNTPSIETVVLASYNSQTERDQNLNNIWYRNHCEMFNYKEDREDILPNNNTAPIILNYNNPDKFQIAMRWHHELNYYLNLNQHIKNIYVFGSAWEVCVKERPFGYKSLSEITTLNILSDTACVLAFSGDSPVMDSEWLHIKDNTYYLNT